MNAPDRGTTGQAMKARDTADPDLPDPKRMDRLRAKGGELVRLLIRGMRVETERFNDERARVLSRSSTPSAVDRGASGPAMGARASSMATIEDDTAAEDGTAQFTRTEVLRYADGVIDWYAAKGILHGRLLDAARDLAELYQNGRNAPVGYRQMGAYGGGEMSDARAEAWAEYCEALDQIPIRCQDTCMDVARGKFPGRLNAVDEMQTGFKALAEHWKMGPRK